MPNVIIIGIPSEFRIMNLPMHLSDQWLITGARRQARKVLREKPIYKRFCFAYLIFNSYLLWFIFIHHNN